MPPESAPPDDGPSLLMAILAVSAFASLMIVLAAWAGLP
jgi:hypothetical protein